MALWLLVVAVVWSLRFRSRRWTDFLSDVFSFVWLSFITAGDSPAYREHWEGSLTFSFRWPYLPIRSEALTIDWQLWWKDVFMLFMIIWRLFSSSPLHFLSRFLQSKGEKECRQSSVSAPRILDVFLFAVASGRFAPLCTQRIRFSAARRNLFDSSWHCPLLLFVSRQHCLRAGWLLCLTEQIKGLTHFVWICVNLVQVSYFFLLSCRISFIFLFCLLFLFRGLHTSAHKRNSSCLYFIELLPFVFVCISILLPTEPAPPPPKPPSSDCALSKLAIQRVGSGLNLVVFVFCAHTHLLGFHYSHLNSALDRHSSFIICRLIWFCQDGQTHTHGQTSLIAGILSHQWKAKERKHSPKK